MSFVYSPNRHAIIDPNTGEELQTTKFHRQATRRSVAIFSADGVKAFEVEFENWYMEGGPPVCDITAPVCLVMTAATEFDDLGKSWSVQGPHPDIDRIANYHRDVVARHQPNEQFRFIDKRAR